MSAGKVRLRCPAAALLFSPLQLEPATERSVMLNLVGSMAGMMAIAANLVAISTCLPLSLRHRVTLAAAIGAWVGLASGLGAAGLLAFAPDRPVPLVGVLCAFPPLIVGGFALADPKIRQALLNIPTHVLIGLNGFRTLGALFLFLAAAGRLSGPFPYLAGFGDILTGLFALPLALAVARGVAPPRRTVALWNLFGTIDLVAAVGLGLLSAKGSPLQLIHTGVGSEAMQQLPYCLVPTVLVPFYLITHGVIAAQLTAGRTIARANPASAAA
jgi:hypothetical protein